MYGWRRLVPHLTPHHTVVLMDLRGFGDSERPTTGYDTGTLAADVVALADELGHERFRVMGEDWGAAVAYAVAAGHRHRVDQLVFQEMRLPGLEPDPDNSDLSNDDTRTGWHFTFFALPGYPELLLPVENVSSGPSSCAANCSNQLPSRHRHRPPRLVGGTDPEDSTPFSRSTGPTRSTPSGPGNSCARSCRFPCWPWAAPPISAMRYAVTWCRWPTTYGASW